MCKSTSTVILLMAFNLSLFSQDTANYKRLYMGNDTHVDLMYNGDEEKWSKLILEMADFYLGLGESSITEEPRKRSKWNYDCAYWLYVLEKKTPPQYFDRIIAQLKNQQASVPYNFKLPIYEAFTPEIIHDPSVLVWSLKPSETSGTSLRVWNMGNSKTVSISFDKNFQKASETTHVETEIGPLSILTKKVNLNVKQQEMKTIKVE
jgi:hypothetical protein